MSDFTLEELLAEKQRRQGSTQPNQTGGVDIQSLLAQATGQQRSPAQSFGRALSIMGGGKPQDEMTDLNKLYAQEAIKKQFENPLESQYKQAQIDALKSRQGGGYFFVDENGIAHPVEGTQPGQRPLPAGTTPVGQQRYQTQADLNTARLPLVQEQAKTQESVNKMIQDYSPGSNQPNEAGIRPGTSINAGPINIPLNPMMTEGEAGRVSALPTMNRLTSEIKQIVQSPEYSQGNNMQHAMRGIAVDQTKMPFLTFGDKFASDLQSKLANLKTTFFSEGGKNLTKNEIDVLSPLLEISGKSPERIVQDYDTFIIKYNEFLKAKQGGLFGYQQGQQENQMSPEEESLYQKYAEQ